MSIQREEIQINQFTTGTTLTYFSTHLSAFQSATQKDPTIEYVPSILWLDNFDSPVKLSTFDGQNLWSLNSANHYVPIDELVNNHVTGHSYVVDVNYIVGDSRLNQLRDRFTKNISASLSPSATTTTSGGIVFNNTTTPPHRDHIFADFHEIDDFYVNLKLNRTFGTLDTLDIYNNLVNSMPTQESETGVVFGRLMALQNIKDVKGNNIKIPLRNVPIGIFNASTEYPTSSSVSDNGDRIFLNTKESALPEEYFNIESYSVDTNNYLRSASQFTTVPDHYKYITTTNENGEFIIYDAPVGTQIVVFEVDLFKQGLTKDEIALNFFQFPPDNDNILDTIPNFSFKQFPIDVVPAWGTIQTGYTELNITVNMDLRKWATFYIPPIAYDGNKLGSIELLNFSPNLNVEIKDMSKPGFPVSKIPVVEIHDIYAKDEDHTLLWDNEFSQLKSTVKFYDHGFKAFKVRANMYDPDGYRTDIDGIPTNYPLSQGVWLAGYQFKLYYNQKDSIFRTTGFQRDWGYPAPGWIGRDHFHQNRGETSNKNNTSVLPQTYAPYDRPWDHLYPDKYKIPAKPIVPNFDRNNPSTRLPGSAPYYLEQPAYKDGDLIGLSVNNPVVLQGETGGFGVQYSYTNNFWFYNRFSKEVTASYIYKYEGGVAWNETYANGYEPSNPSFPVDPQASYVVNGEKYQRVECGYGYWLRPEGWPVVSHEPWGDTIFSMATRPGYGLTSSFEPSVLQVGTNNGNIKVQAQNLPIDVYNIEDKDIALALDNNANYSEGSLNIYRIIDPNDRVPQGPTVIPTSAIYKFQSIYYQRGGNAQRIQSATKNGGGNDNEEDFSRAVGGVHGGQDYQYLKIEITNNGNISVTIPGTSTTLGPGESHTFTATEINLDNLTIELPGNTNFNFTTSKYQTANYTMKFKDIIHLKEDGTSWNSSQSIFYDYVILGTSVPADSTPPDYYLCSRYTNLRTQYNNDNSSCENGANSQNLGSSANKWVNTVKMDGALFKTPNTSNNGDLYDIRFWTDPISPTCGSYGYNDGVQSIAIQVE